MSKPVTIYGQDDCVHCERAREHLASRNIGFAYVNLSEQPSRRDELRERLGNPERLTVPQIWIKAEYVGGCAELRMIPDAHLQAMVGGA